MTFHFLAVSSSAIQHSISNGEREQSVLPLGYLCLPCYMQDRAFFLQLCDSLKSRYTPIAQALPSWRDVEIVFVRLLLFDRYLFIVI